eukprot:2235129-Rhodomonas_salina.2
MPAVSAALTPHVLSADGDAAQPASERRVGAVGAERRVALGWRFAVRIPTLDLRLLRFCHRKTDTNQPTLSIKPAPVGRAVGTLPAPGRPGCFRPDEANCWWCGNPWRAVFGLVPGFCRRRPAHVTVSETDSNPLSE